MSGNSVIPKNELERIIRLSEFDLDYLDLEDNFKDLTRLAAKVANTEISLVNLIDTFTQWSVSSHNLDLKQMSRDQSVCQYTIMDEIPLEVKDLSQDDRFKDKVYVTEGPELKYYFGIPLKVGEGINFGALCVLDKYPKEISPEKVELLQIIASEIVNRIKAIKAIQDLKNEVREIQKTNKKVAHDIRGPIGGIIGLAQIIQQQGDENKLEEVLEFIHLIQKSGKSILELADEILTEDYRLPKEMVKKINPHTEFNLVTLKQKIVDMYAPQALLKNIELLVINSNISQEVNFPKNKLMQIVGNLISNALKFTPEQGRVTVNLDLEEEENRINLKIKVRDTGVGLTPEKIEEITNGVSSSVNGTNGEMGYGFGLNLVRHLINGMKGTFDITSSKDNGAVFSVELPL
ncbi:hypothetical protein P872_10490 [Rhodonellum psychrophilum GCM71 = DSM 17998]|uniref:histidine kinase n=2 Tax=Rhodonellum TaxID=336827 RepID=U5BV41_9BACT|nr:MULTISPECIES: ATP-binding protein [Rhodonellum]ERM81404.1 hypothetical protein P872_10490 [Rhodonellum psychrophilum GCM71 = DSM 17998]SDZ56707.1 Signal transduction histidine kinase [Rhodonellum ikkaensis]